MEEQEQMDVASVFRVIFCSCDVDNTDLVPVSKLIEFVQPFMVEDLNALEDLRHSLDPEGKNALVNSETFYQVMSLWSQKFAATSSNDEETEFNKSPSRLQVIDEKELPYTHSTPRASLGDKLLKCKDLLNLSNVSGYSLSTSRLDTTNPADSDKTVLEEEIKKLEHQLSKTSNELTITKQQLTASEEQNETLQHDLDRLNRRLHAEQQVNEHLQKEKIMSEELRDELGKFKKVIDDLKKKLSQSEKDSMYHRDVIDELDNEKLKLEKKIEVLSKQHQDDIKQIFDFKTELETKEQQMADFIKAYDELKLNFAKQKDFNDQLREENDILSLKKSTLEKALKAKSFNSPHSNLGNLNLDLSKTPSPRHDTQNTSTPPRLSSPILAYQNGAQPKCQSVPLLRRVLARHSSTPINTSHSLLDSSLPESVKSVPVLSPVPGAKHEESDQRQDSSEEDLYWKLQQGEEGKIEGHLNGTTDSLQIEMHRADPIRINETYHTDLFEKDERIIELEEELETVKMYLKEIEDQKNEFLSTLKEQKKINESLIENNFMLVTREEFSQTKIESLKNRLAHLEKNGVIMENDHENSHGEIEDLKNKIKTLEEESKNKEIETNITKSRIECYVLLEREIDDLKEKLRNTESRKMDYDERLQEAMRDLGKLSVEKISVEEKLKALHLEKQNVDDSNALVLEEALKQTKDLAEKLSGMDQLNKDITDKNKLLEDGNIVLKRDLECAVSKYETLSKRFAMIEKELCDFKDFYKDQEIARFENDKKQITYKFEEKLRLKDEELKNTQKQKDKELEIFKENLEKKIVGEFEGKVKYSMEAEEKILNLTKKCKQLEEDLKSSLSKLSSKSRILAETENEMKCLRELQTSLKPEIDCLKGSKTKLESTVASLKGERECLYAQLQKVDNIDVVASGIQKHIKDKDNVIEELKQLNKKMEYNLDEAQLDLKEKIDEILKLRNEWSKSINIKNDLWNRIKSLQKENYRLNAENIELLEKERELSSSNEALHIEHNNLLILFDVEVNKTSKLSEQVALLTKEKDQYWNRYNELKKEFDNIISKFDTEKQKKIESDKLLKELETRLNEEIVKNGDITKDFLELKQHFDHSNIELLEMKQKITNNETEMVAKLQQKIENNNRLAKELAETKEILHAKNVALKEVIIRVSKTELEIEMKNTELLKKLTNVEGLLEKRQMEMICIQNINQKLGTRLDSIQKEKDKINNELEQKQMKITLIENRNVQLQDELTITKQEKEILNNELQESQCEITRLKEKRSENDMKKNRLLHETKQKLQEEITKNKAIFNKFSLLKQERDQLSLDLNDIKTLLSDTKTLYNKKLTELKDLQAQCSELNSKIQIQGELLKKTEMLLQDEINKNNQEKLINTELLNIKSSLEKAYLELKNMEVALSKTKEELNVKRQENEKLITDLEQAKRKLSESFNSDGSTCSNVEKDTCKRRTYSRQQISIDKLKDKLEDMENELKLERSKNQELQTRLLLSESKIIGDKEGYKKEIEKLQEKITVQEKKLEKMETEYLEKKNLIPISLEEKSNNADEHEIKCEAKTVNKFTLAARCPASPDSPSTDTEVNGSDVSKKVSFVTKYPFNINCDSTIEIPPLDVNGFADDIIEELELINGSPRTTLDREGTEKNVTALTLRLLINSNDISERIENQTEKYRCQYEELLNLIRDISHRLRDHVCIGTAEPIMPVFVLLEDIKLQLKEVVQTAGQVGVLIYEDRMKKCWSLVTNYMAMLRQENESLHNISRETTPTQTGLLRRRNKCTQDKEDLTEPPYRRRRCTRLTTTLLFLLAFALTVSIIIHVNCRMTASENQYCPLDGMITRINVGVPPM